MAENIETKPALVPAFFFFFGIEIRRELDVCVTLSKYYGGYAILHSSSRHLLTNLSLSE